MGSPSGVTHSTVCPDWAMSLALSVSQVFSRGKQGRKWLELVRAAGRRHPLPAQASPTPATNCDCPALRGVWPCSRHNPTPLGWDRRLHSGPGPRRTIYPHRASPGLCMGGPGKKKRQREIRGNRHLTWISRVAENISLMPLNTCFTR